MRVLGIDPGRGGGLSVIETDGPVVVGAESMPLLCDGGIDFGGVRHFVLSFVGVPVVIERQLFITRSRSLAASPINMVEYGGLLGCLWDIEGKYLAVPSVWKRDMGLLGVSKEGSRVRATSIFGGDGHWPRKRDEGIAEASLLGLWRGVRLGMLGAGSVVSKEC